MQYILFCILVVLSISAFSQTDDEEAIHALDSQSCHSKIVEAKRDYYRRTYPDILFVIFKGGDETLDDMVVLDTLLGPNPVNLDYEHPNELREDLMIVSAGRVWFMLQNSIPSATLFKADNPLGWQEHICVVTLDPCVVASSNLDATGYMLELPIEELQNVPEEMCLDKEDCIEFTIDHEAYHCLKSMYVGPQTMSSHTLWGEYNHYLEEKGADAFALAMHIRKHNRLTPFAENITRIRGASLLNADPNHFTCDALKQMSHIPIEELTNMTDAEVFNLANQIKKERTISYDEYLDYLAAAISAIKILESENANLSSLEEKIKGVKVNQDLVKKLVESSRSCLSELQIQKKFEK
ncbi:MAG: hypothetical protein AMJ53_04725 [Gammaproteobacteria bacterium SG8_11]|nr:MAG: hypothetical protein AMJ53_04725 [Gammaproteobacteria bacterium SG8_11]